MSELIYPQYRIEQDGEVLGEHWHLSLLKTSLFGKNELPKGAIVLIKKAKDGDWKPVLGQ